MNGSREHPFALAWALVNQTFDEFSRARGTLLAAALAFHTLLAMAPLTIVAVAVAGIILGRGPALDEVTRLLADTLGTEGAMTVRGWVQEASAGGEVASVLGVALMLWTGSRLGSELRESLNQMWGIDVFMAEGFKASLRHYLRRRLAAFLIVAAAGPALLFVFASRAALFAFHAALFEASRWRGVAIQALQVGLSLMVVAAASAAVLRYVPDTRIGWKNVLVGGALTSVLFNLGNLLVGLYLGRASVGATYGAAGSAVVVLLWLYFSAQMFLFGASFTHVYTRRFGWGLNSVEARERTRAAELASRKARDAA